jgi:hypothetical protein
MNLGPFFWVWGDLTKARPLQFIGDDLFGTLQKTSLVPGQVIEGWALFVPPEEYDIAPQPIRYQIQIRDAEGASCSIETFGPEGGEDKVVTPRGLSVSPGQVDLSTYHYRLFQ